MIAPLILGFTALGCSIMHLVYKYNILYVFASEIDTRGLSYILAIKQLLTGLYLAQICLLGLFALRLTFGPVVMMFISITVTAVVHISLDEAVGPLLDNLPRTLSSEKTADPGTVYEIPAETAVTSPDYGELPWETQTAGPASNVEILDLPLDNPDAEVTHTDGGPRTTSTNSTSRDPTLANKPDDYDSDYDSDTSTPPSPKHASNSNARALEGAEGLAATTFTLLKMLARATISPSPPPTTDHSPSTSPLDPGSLEPLQPPPKEAANNNTSSTTKKTARDALATLTKAHSLLTLLLSPPDPPPPPPSSSSPLHHRLTHTLLSFLHPEIYASFPQLQLLLPPADVLPDVSNPGFRDPYAYPAMISGAPRLWVPDDGAGAGCGEQERAHSGRVTGVVGREGCWVGGKWGKVEVGLGRGWGELVGEEGGRTWLRDGGLDWGRCRWW